MTDNWLTIPEVQERLNVHRSVVVRHIRDGLVRSKRVTWGTRIVQVVLEGDLQAIAKATPPGPALSRPRVHMTLSAKHERYHAWKRAADERGETVTKMLANLADEFAGWTG